MNGEICIYCEKPMGNSNHTRKLHKIEVKIHSKCNLKLGCPCCGQNYPNYTKVDKNILKKECWKCGTVWRYLYTNKGKLFNDFFEKIKIDLNSEESEK